MNTVGLSLHQAPPFKVIVPFFIASLLSGLGVAWLLGVSTPDQIMTSGSWQSLALLHGVTLGVMGFAMLGALLQMLPVMGGIVIASPLPKGRALFILWGMGGVMLLLGLSQGWMGALGGAAVFLAVALVVIGWSILFPLWQQSIGMPTIRAMGFALISLIIGGTIGVAILGSLHSDGGLLTPLWLGLHRTWMLFGWVFLLLIGVSYQIIPMFYVSPSYHQEIQKKMTMVILGVMLLETSLQCFDTPLILGQILLAGCVIVWGGMTLTLLSRRKRASRDTTLFYWYGGVSLIILSALLWIVTVTTGWGDDYLLGVMALGGCVAIIRGMMYKIVPFMTWFHLTNQGFFEAPTMKEMINAQWAMRELWCYGIALLSLLTLPWHGLPFLCGGLLGVSFSLLLYNIAQPLFIYKSMMGSKR